MFELFYLAEQLHKTVDELLTGQSGPLSNTELIYWRSYYAKKRELEEEASKD